MHAHTSRYGFLVVLAILGVASNPVMAEPKQDATLLNATQVLTDLRDAPDRGVPNWLLERAYAVAVVPKFL